MAELRNFLCLPLVLWVWPGDALAGIRVLHHPDPVPDEAPHIKFVEEHPCTALRISVDGVTVPPGSSWWRNAFPVEVPGKIVWDTAGCIGCKDLPDNLCLLFDNLEFARATRDCSIAIGPASGVTSVTNNSSHAPTHFLGAVFPLHLTDKSTNTDEDCIGGAVMDSLDFDAEEREPFVKACEIRHAH